MADADPPTHELDVGAMLGEIDRLEQGSRERGDAETWRRLVRLRHEAGAALAAAATATPEAPAPAADLPVPTGGGLPEFRPGDLTPELLRTAILRDGCALVRGMVDRDQAVELGESCKRLFEWRDRVDAESANGDGRAPTEGGEGLSFEEFMPNPPYESSAGLRRWTREGGGIWLADSPKLMSGLFGIYEQAGLCRLVNGYIGERPVITLNKSTLRSAHASTAGVDFHQDGAFLGDAPALNVWMSLSHCGDVAPGLALIPRRIDHILPTGTPGATHDWSVSSTVVDEAAGEASILRPIFEPGDLIFFDDLFVHATWVEPEMPDRRFAIETWFFSPARIPQGHAPLVF